LERKIDPYINAIPIYSIMRALEKIGISPELLGPQTSEALLPIASGLIKSMLGQDMPKSLGDALQMLKAVCGMAGIADGDTMEASVVNGDVSLKLSNCMWSDIAELAKTGGYNHCPMCIVGSLLMGAMRGLDIADLASLRVERKENDCSILMFSE
jgi:hypothetical protein